MSEEKKICNTGTAQDEQNFATICEFADKLVNSQKDVPDDIAEIVNEHFFEML